MTGVATPGLADLLSVMGSLSIILVLLAISAYVVKKLRSGRLGYSLLAPSPIQIIASRSLGRQSSLLIVEVRGTQFLVGSGRAGIAAIGALNPVSGAGAVELK
jgi:flagellar biogenesis protein FliO